MTKSDNEIKKDEKCERSLHQNVKYERNTETNGKRISWLKEKNKDRSTGKRKTAHIVMNIKK